jgi:membrane-bound lytic murein transglycosylase D
MFGSWELALAAYNCGEGCVGRAIAWNQKRNLPTDYLSLSRLPPETRNYVPKLIAVKNIVLAPLVYGIEIDSIPDEPYFTTVEAPARIDVKVAAQLAGMTEEEFKALNPANNKPVAVAATGTLVVPLDKADVFRENLENYDQPLVTWTTYGAKRGESIDAIARRHGLTASALRMANEGVRLDKRGRLRSAGPILVPMHRKPGSPPAKESPVVAKAPVAAVAVANAASAPVAKAAPAAAAKAAASTYVVRAGDTLYGIARKFGTAVEELMSLNKLSTAAIRPGLRLRLN